MGVATDRRIAAACEALPVVLREPVERWFERFTATADTGRLDDTSAVQLVRLVACSDFASDVVLRHANWFAGNVAAFSAPPVVPGSDTLPDRDDIRAALRICRNRYLLQVLWRDLFGLANLDETLYSLSALADRMLDIAVQHAEQALRPRYGEVHTRDGKKVPPVILGMGKLGGYELNFSSDIDIVFLYPEDGETNGHKRVSAQEYFGRLSREVIALLGETTADGFVFRIDTRLRPFGASGPPVVSFAALESYLLQHGRDWERYAYIKARIVGPQPGDKFAGDLYQNLIQPFVYRRYIDYGVFAALREMHAMIAAEVKRRELEDNIKLGPGGIREAEFIVQSLQLVRGGSVPALQSRALQPVLPLLANDRGLSAAGARALGEAYRFLRRLENFIQAMHDRQTHDLPADDVDRARLCLAMGHTGWETLCGEINRHRAAIAAQFERVAMREQTQETPFRKRIEQFWESGADEAAWSELLENEGLAAAPGIAKKLVTFANGELTRQIGATARARLQRFIGGLVLEIAASNRPLRALGRTLSVVERVLRRSAYLALLNENRGALARLVDLCARSQYIAGQIAHYPALLDELLDPRRYTEAVTRADFAAELEERLRDNKGDSESVMRVIGQFQRATMFRIAVADFGDNLPIMKVSDGLTWLAETVLEEVLRIAWRDLVERHGVPCYELDGVVREAGFGIIAYGKLGGLELSYGSDLDIVFLHDSSGTAQVSNGDRPVDNGLFFGRLVRRLVHFLTTQTGSGQLYEIDTRLRPDGRRGLLVTSTEAFERYQEDNAWTWEHQALLRARAVAGSHDIADEFARIRRETLLHRVRRDTLRDDVIAMRRRMRKELDRSNEERFDLKHGRGGIGDIEFLVQFLVLDQAEAHPGVVSYSDNIRQLDALTAEGCLDRNPGEILQDIYREYRRRQHHLVLDDQPPFVAPNEFTRQRAFVAKTWDEWLG